MSLILDALKRAERERRSDHAPVLEGSPAPVPPRPVRRWPWRLAGLVLLLAAAAAVAWTYVRKPPQQEAAPAAAAQAPAERPAPLTEPPRAAPDAPPEAEAPPADPPIIPGTESVASLEEVTEGVVDPPPPAPARPDRRPADPGPVEPAAPGVTGSDEAAAESADDETPGRPIPPALTQPAPVRKLREMPPDYRADFPALTVQVHVFEREPAQRFVLVNGRRYRQGERLAEGPQLLEIVREGMVLDYRGQKVLYTLGR